MPARPNRKTRRLSFQSLECRTPMAGDVAVWLDGDVLHVLGNNLSNGVRIATVGEETRVVGMNTLYPTTPTTINGSSNPFLFTGIQNVVVDLGGGNDEFLMDPNPQYCAGDVSINMGQGSDKVTLESVTIEGDLSIDTLGGKGDTIMLNRVTAANIDIDTADGNDTISVYTVNAGRILIDSTSSLLERDYDNITLSFINATDVGITTGKGIDTIGLGFVTIARGNLVIDAGADNDSVYMDECSIDKFFARMGEGDDLLDIHTSAINALDLQGQGGRLDELKFTNMRRIGSGPITGFETMSNTNDL